MAGLHFDITGDNSNFLRKLREVETGVTNTSKEIEKNGLGIEDMFNKMTKAAAAFGAGFTAKELIQNIIQVRGEFQQLEVAFTTMLGSSEKANVLMAQLTETAAKTPFDLQGVANGARQLLAYGTSAEDVNETLIRLGNIAAGLSQPLGDLVYLYGTTMTQGRLYTQDLNQFTGRGIPMIKELAKEFGVAESEIKGMVEAGMIGFPEVQKVIQNLTNEGGMFFNLMQEQSKTITGQISNIGDSFSMMLNEIGKANEGIINDALSSVSYLIENYEKVGKILIELVGTYGAYRTALMAITALHNLQAAGITALTAKEAIHYSWLVLTQKAQSLLNKTLLANPYVAVAAAVAALGLGIYKLVTYQTEAEKAQERLNDEFGKTEVAALNEMSTLRELNRQLTEAKKWSDEWYAIKEKIVNGYSKYLSGIDEEIDKTGSLAGQYEKLEKAIRKSMAAQNYTNFAKQEEDIYNSVREKNLTKVYDAFTKKYGDESGLKVYRNWLNWLDSGRDIPTEIQRIFNDVSTGWGESANTLLFEIRRQAEIRNKNLEEYRNKYFIPEPSFDSPTENIFTTEGKSISQLEEEIKKAETSLASLKKALADGSGTKEAVDQQEAYIKSLQNTILEREKDLRVINEVKTQISKLEKEQGETVSGSKEYNALQSRIDALRAKLPKTKSDKAAEDKQAKEQKEAEQKLVDELLELRKKNQEKEISLWEEGKDKKLKQINYYYEEQKKEIKKKEKELAELNKVAKIEPSKLNENGLTTEQQENIDTANRLNEKNKNKQTKEILDDEINAMNDYLAAYGNYYEKRNAIIEQGESRKVGKNEWEQKSIDEETKRALSDLDIEANKSTSAISKLFDDMRQHTVADMRLIANEAERAFQFLQSGEWDENKGLEFGMTKETFDTLRKSPEELERIRKGIDNVRNSADQSETGFNKLSNGLKKVFDAGSNTKKLQDGLEEIRSGLSEILSVAQFLSDTFSNLGEAFGSDTLSGIAEGINVAMDGLNSAMQGAEAGAIFGPIGSAAGAAIGLVSSLASSIAKIHDAKNEKRIQKLQDQVDTLDRSYEKLGKSIETAYGKSASSLIEDQNKLLEQQKVLIQNQIKEEQDKKNTDSDRIKEWENQIDEINNLISDNKEKAIDVIFGEDLKSAIDNFAEAYADAWASGENRAKSAKDVVKQMMQQMVTESIKAAIKSSNKMEEIRTKLQQFYADNVLSQWEQDYINNMAEQLQQEIDAQFGWADSLMGESSTTEQKSTAEGFETMSQDTATELNGRFTALQLSGEEIKNQMISAVISLNSLLSVSTNSNSILNNILNQHVITNSYLEDIAKYTKLLIDIKSDIAQVNRNTKDL
ncbi:tape measure protein [Barnesiella intestinihominis]|uniref:tape measure protein n=1 Tax=Barnesiella intestinihominis TaxID=487174 RepID=UPI0018996AFD|nr:tape measure protein [Barnesiella intestinihominis]MDB0664179.1 tape measure protein [Barnesiella intestinihominis]MDB0666673.1 tape measure protein [Barnesiella intestinihominis]